MMVTSNDAGWPTPRRKIVNTYGRGTKAKVLPASRRPSASKSTASKPASLQQATEMTVDGPADDVWSVPMDDENLGKPDKQNQQVPPSPTSTGQQSSEEVGSAAPMPNGIVKRRRVEDLYAVERPSGRRSNNEDAISAAALMPSPMSRAPRSPPAPKVAPSSIKPTVRQASKPKSKNSTVKSPKSAAAAVASPQGRRSRVQSPVPPSEPPSPTSPVLPSRAKSSTPVLSGRVAKARVESPMRRKSRLIDRLTAQVEQSSDEGEEEDQVSSRSKIDRGRTHATPEPVLPSTPLAMTETPSRATALQVTIAKTSGPRLNYGMKRSMLAVSSGLQNLEEDTDAMMPMIEDLSQPLVDSTSAYDGVPEDDETENGAVKGIHELRQAGANNRFEDAMNDALDCIRTPGEGNPSRRRSALLELAQKMHNNGFRRQFRTHVSHGRFFEGLDREKDTITGFAISSILVTFLSGPKALHLVQELHSQGIQVLLSRLLDESQVITAIAKERRSNLSANARKVVGAIESALLPLPTWLPVTISELSPRTLALKCAGLLVEHAPGAQTNERLLSGTLLAKLFTILADARAMPSDDAHRQRKATDALLALRLLEHHSVIAVQTQPDWAWTRQQLSDVAAFLDFARTQSSQSHDALANSGLRLILNASNNSQATEMLARRGMLEQLFYDLTANLGAVMESNPDGLSRERASDTLTLLLCILINFCEHFAPSIERLQELGNTDPSAFTALFAFFFDYHSKTGEADSVEKGKMNVAFGFLSVLIGYLCQSVSIRHQFAAFRPGRGMNALLEAIREFIAIRQATRQQGQHNNPGQGGPEANDTDSRLQELVAQLQAVV